MSKIKLLILVCLLLVAVSQLITGSIAQTSCNLWDENQTGLSPFPEGSVIYLNLSTIKNSTDAKLREWANQTIVSAENWNQALAQKGSTTYIDYISSPPPGARTITVIPSSGTNPNAPASPAWIHRTTPDPNAPTYDAFGNLKTVTILVNLNATFPSGGLTVNPLTSGNIGIKVMDHEIAHTFGMKEAKGYSGPNAGCGVQTPGATVMNSICGHNDSNNNMPTGVTPCDATEAALWIFGSSPPPGSTPTPTPTPTPDDLNPPDGSVCEYDYSGLCQDCSPEDDTDWNNCILRESQWQTAPTCRCVDPSPILIDVNGDGLALSSREDGVPFDINLDGVKNRVPWTRALSDDALLVLDRNHNGTIDNSLELFGDQTEQPASAERNGFIALAGFDKNKDGLIDKRDEVFTNLRLWQDANHDGVSQSTELLSLPQLGLVAIELNYKRSKQIDVFGNEFRYRAKVRDAYGSKISRWAWDVFLTAK